MTRRTETGLGEDDWTDAQRTMAICRGETVRLLGDGDLCLALAAAVLAAAARAARVHAVRVAAARAADAAHADKARAAAGRTLEISFRLA